nr:30-kDa cleavage and polyadenylation specificity factor 30-like [Ipomoea batatas]
MAWSSMMPLGCGARPVPGMQGYTSGMMADGFSYGALTQGGFPMHPRHFGLYRPRFSGDMMFHKRPLASGFAMMMGAGRSPFVGAAGLPSSIPSPITASPKFFG